MAGSIAEVRAELTGPGQPFEMEDVVIEGVPTRIWKRAPATLRDVLVTSRTHGDTDYLVYAPPPPEPDPEPAADRLTFARHFDLAATLAHHLIDDFGVRPGDRVAIMMRNFPEWSVAFWAATAAGAVVVPLNAWWQADELAFGLADSGVSVVVADAERADRIAGRLGHVGLTDRLVVARADPSGLPAGALAWDDVLAGGPGDGGIGLPDVVRQPDDDATILYTSGTTGRPKGVLGTHRNICTNLVSLQYSAALAARRRPGPTGPPSTTAVTPPAPPRSCYLLSVPFFHVTGCHSVLVTHAASGGTVVLMHRWDPERVLDLIERERVTTFGGVPSMALQVLDSPRLATTDVSSVVSVRYGGAPAPPELVRRIAAAFPGRVASNGYGLTETSSVAVMNAGVDYLEHPGSIGVPVPVCDVRVVDERGEDVPAGEAGELLIRGPNVVKGYWNRPQETVTTFGGGWLHTGDVVRVGEDGFITVVDRAKDLVIRGGENISTVEVEAVLFEHPAVADAAVIGVPHPVLGEEVGAAVVLRPGARASADELRAHVAGHLAAFKVPSHVWVLDHELPRNPAGKVLKRTLRAQLVRSPADAPTEAAPGPGR